MPDFESYREIMPLVFAWLLDVEANVLKHGRALTDLEQQDAYSVGVSAPEKIRLLSVPHITQPDNPQLLHAGRETGLLLDNTAARAIRYGIEVVDGESSRALLRHEFRHVQQFEQADSFEAFIVDYIKAVFDAGYYESFYERDARAHEQVDPQ